MTTVLDRPHDGPATHVLVIGVGVYDHLIGGKSTLLDNPFGLGQLGSPPVSAKRFTEWVLRELHNPAAPLASVEVVISSPTPTLIDVPNAGPESVESAVMANIQPAFDGWRERLKSNAANVGIFYHCGHGLESSDLALLAQDFGAPGGDPGQLWTNAYNFHRTHLGMARCKADGQFYFVDSCRQVTADMLEFGQLDVQPLCTVRLRGLNSDRNAPIVYGSVREAQAFARSDEASRFTTALIEAMESNGARRHNGAWQVSNDSLPEAVLKRVQRGNVRGVPEQHATQAGESASTSVVHVLGGPPPVPAFVEALTRNPFPQSTRLEFRSGADVAANAPGPGPWSLNVTAGVYDVVAVDAGAPVGQAVDGWVVPPEYEGTIR